MSDPRAAPEAQPPKQRGFFATGIRGGALGCVGCLTFVVLAALALIVLIVLVSGGDGG